MQYRHHARTARTRLRHQEAGEGVISTAIAVLIMAFIGAAMWVAFNAVFEGAEQDITDQVGRIGEASAP
ncbi:MAG: hypothetical protein WD638_09560 [Nitriliruptoraceae bacterium]